MKYYIDLDGIASKEALWGKIAETMRLPDYFGKNLDAFYDIMTDIADFTEVVFLSADMAEESVIPYIERLKSVCEAITEENPSVDIYFEKEKSDDDDIFESYYMDEEGQISE